MPKNPHADFTPTLAGYSGITPFRFWCQTALPLTYDDSLSYYELLNKVVNYLNHTIEDLTNVENNTSELAEAYDKLQKYVNDYFDDIDIEAELRNVLDGMVEDGTLDALLDPLVANRLPDVVGEQISDVVAAQIDDAVEGQIGGAVEEQLPPLVDANIGEEVSTWLTENVDPVGSAVLVDNTLTISGAAADSRVTGEELNELKRQLIDFTGNEVIPITSGGYIVTNGDTVNISSITSSPTYGYAICDCVPGEIFTITGRGGATPRLFAFAGAEENGTRQILTKAYNSMTLNNEYIIAPPDSEKLIVNVNITSDNEYSLVRGKLITNVWDNLAEENNEINNIKKAVTFPNLANPNEFTSGYKSNTGSTNPSTTYMYTGFIRVSVGDTLYISGNGARYVCAFDINKVVLADKGSGVGLLAYTVPEGVAFVQITFYVADIDSIIISKQQNEKYVPFGTPVIDNEYIPKKERKLNYVRESNDLSANGYLLIDKHLPIKDGAVIQFSGNITGEFSGIEIGFTDDISQSDLTHFKIDSTKFYRVTSSPIENAHHLTISGNISITITQTFTHLLVDVICNGQKYHSGNGWAPLNKMPYVKVLSSMTDCVFSWTATKNRKDIVIFGDSYVSYGESRWIYYLDNDDKYIENITIIGYSGEASENGYTNFMDFVPYSNAKYIVWAYGMNDMDSGGVVNATWKEKIDAVIAYCKDHNIVPVLCTIPNVPSRDNSLKNTYVRTFVGTYPVIDFAKAVGSDISATWYIAPDLASDSQTLSINHTGGYNGNITSVDFDGGTVTENALVDKIIMINNVPTVVVSNTASTITFASTNFGTINDDATIYPAKMLSTDNVHPTSIGAKALYNRAIADFPQLCVK